MAQACWYKLCKYSHLQALLGCNFVVKEVLSPLSLASSEGSHLGSLFTNEELKKCWLVRYLILIPPILTLIVMSLIQTAWQKMAALSNISF